MPQGAGGPPRHSCRKLHRHARGCAEDFIGAAAGAAHGCVGTSVRPTGRQESVDPIGAGIGVLASNKNSKSVAYGVEDRSAKGKDDSSKTNHMARNDLVGVNIKTSIPL